MHNTVGVYKPGEPDKGRQPSQPEPSKLGKGKMYNNTRKHTTLLQYISTNRQPNQPEPSKPEKNIVKYKTYVHYNTNKHTCPCAAGMSSLFRCPAAMHIRWQLAWRLET